MVDADAEHMEILGVPVRNILMPAIEAALKDMGGMNLNEVKVSSISIIYNDTFPNNLFVKCWWNICLLSSAQHIPNSGTNVHQ